MGCGDGIPDFTPEELAETTNQVRDALHLRDYAYGAELGEQWVAWAPDALELKAWTVANMAKADLGNLSIEMAEELMARKIIPNFVGPLTNAIAQRRS